MAREKGVDRRNFIKGTAAGVGAVAAGHGLLTEVGAAQDYQPQSLVPDIRPSEIKETISADVVVVGVGISGTCAGLAAIEGGSKVVMIEKGANYNARGFDDGAFNSSVHKEKGILYNREELIQELMIQANYRVDQRLVTTWVDQSGPAIDWLRAMVEPRGVKASVGGASYSMVSAGQDREGPYKVWRTAVNWTGQNAGLMKVLHEILKEKAADIRYKHRGVKLVRDGKGRITAVVASKEGGGYVQFNARKGIILSCGGYDNNPEMMKKYLRPSDLRIARFNSMNKLCTGDGLNMGLAVGADMDEPPHCLIVGCGIIPTNEEFYLAMFTPWLRVDRNGRRYINEDSDYCRAANANAIQPGHFNWVISDSSVGEDVAKQFAHPLKVGAAHSADTIEGLADKMLIDPSVLKATVDRYNELARNKKDLDFGVMPEKMRPVLKAPYYAVQTRNFALVTVSGLRINENMQVLDKNGKVIPGLYASGNTSGGFFSDTYQRNVHGVSHGRAITFGRLAGMHAAAQKI